MSKNLETRINKLEAATYSDKYPLWLMTKSEQCGDDGEIIWHVTEEQAKQKHLALHPEDTGRDFNFINRVFVHGGWNDLGQLICKSEECSNFGNILKKYSTNGNEDVGNH